jgi:HK97 family phage major capsid protein
MSKYLTPAMQELRAALIEADEITKRSEGGRASEARLSFLLAKIKSLNAGAEALPNEQRDQFFASLLSGKEIRELQEGQAAGYQSGQTISYTAGTEGGYLVPQEFNDEVIHGMAQFDPLLDKDVVTLIESPTFALRPWTIPGWDLSTFAAVKVAEGAQQIGAGLLGGGVLPTVSGKILNGYKYKASLPVTMELEQDSFQTMMKLITDAYVIGFARGIGIDLAIGNGTTAPQGALTGATPVYTTAAAGVLSLDDFEAVYFNVNRFHRNQQKCAWLMNDSVYQMARKATDTVGNPLLKLIKDKETIMGKPVLVSPSLPEYNASLGTQAAGSFCVFGDLSHLFVRVSKMVVSRQWQLPGYVENGMALYTGMMRADAKVFDPTGGTVSPLVSASLHE